jgi:NAD(P)H-hydrate repair Nnr-like enzyme with NAD(P)H-hydrate epimerase domain
MDADATTRLGIASSELMENAGAGAARIAMDAFAKQLQRVWVFGGIGQNGGDAWVFARALMKRGVNPTVVLVGAREKISGDAKPNF